MHRISHRSQYGSRVMVKGCLLGLLLTLLPGWAAAVERVSLRNLDSHCPFVPPQSLSQWQTRAADLNLQLRVALGLLPAPELDSVRPQIYGRRDLDGYSVEKCVFESLPGLYVTGSLFRPATVAAGSKVPGILCPHGHWANGRFYEASDVPQQLASGAERFESAAINPIQARCVQLARMGCVVYLYDMLGYADSRQISFARAHGFAKQSPEHEVTDDGWLLFSPSAELHTQSIMGLQTLATQRAVDMLLSLPEVDAARIGITGASGGGTQSFIAAAIDPRIAVVFPAVMVSTGMQGGCTCENCSLLRTGTGNVEMAALIAPRPMGLTAADDWTRTMAVDGYPQLQQVYELFGHKDKVGLFPALHFGHNYNHVSRVAMYGWMSDHLRLGLAKPILETDFRRLTQEELTVWDDQHPPPAGGEDFERRLLKFWADLIEAQLNGMLVGDRQQNQQLAQTLRDGWRVVLGLTTGHALISSAVQLNPALAETTDEIVIQVGEQRWSYLPESKQQELVNYKRLAAGYTYGYNHCQFTQQSQGLARSLLELAAQHPGQTVHISGHGTSAALAAAATFCALELAKEPSASTPPQLSLNLSGGDFRFAQVTNIRDAVFVPGAARYGDFPGLVACLPQAPQWSDQTDTTAFARLAKLRSQ
ncbi:MAG: acetylxylan esterase [Pirellulaceae bacterium]|nr:acetylxylan esterase [Pirellulaceae bacterium]